MDNQALQDDIEIAEALDEHLHEQSVRIEDITGSLEAIGQALMADEEPKQLTDHQQDMVDAYHEASQNRKGDVYAVADKAALETYVDNEGITRAFKPLPGETAEQVDDFHGFAKEYGPNVWGVFKVYGIIIPGNEGFVEMTSALARKAASAFSNEIPQHFKITAKGLSHYAGMAQRLRARLLQLRPLLEKREFPYTDVFDYGAYSRFFQVNGKSIGGFSGFAEAMEVQSAAMTHVLRAADSYGVVIMEKLLKSLQELQAVKKPDAEAMIALRNSIEQHWEFTWQQANITLAPPGQTPQDAANSFPERKFTCLAPLLDNRYLVAHAPKNSGGENPSKISVAIKHYGASVVFDKKAAAATQHSMNVPNSDDLLQLLDKVVDLLHDMGSLEALAKKNDAFAKDFKKATDVLVKQIAEAPDGEFCGFVAEYFKLATAIGQSIQHPYVQMAWLYLRCAMVLVSLTELAVIEEPKQRIATARFFAKQRTEFGNPALESFRLTQKALKAAIRASVV